ncbi:hypothetical protein ACCS70_18755 [Rhizobium ruizarguesonis]
MARTATFLLLHGTFARGAKWTLPDSPLCQRINAVAGAVGVRADIRAIPWSGRNSSADRMDAAREIASALQRIDRDASPQVFLIGHSHGGSAIAHFLLNRQAEGAEISGCAFLSTPFIAARIRPDAFLTYAALVAIIASVGFVLLSILLDVLVGGALTLIFDDFGGSNILAVAIDVISLLTIGLALKRQPQFYRRIMTGAKLRISKNETARAKVPACLLLRVSRDEAATALAFGQFVATLSSTLTSAAMFVVARASLVTGKLWSSRALTALVLAVGVFFGFFIVGVIAATAWGDFFYIWHGAFDTGETFDFSLPMVDVAFNFILRRVLWIPFAAVTIVILAGVGLYVATVFINGLVIWGFGWVRLIDSIFAEVSVEPTPFGAHQFHHVAWSEDSRGPLWSRLSHSATYQSAASIDAMGEWLRNLLTPRLPD